MIEVPRAVSQFAVKAYTVENQYPREIPHGFVFFNPTAPCSPDKSGDFIPHLAHARSVRPPASTVSANVNDLYIAPSLARVITSSTSLIALSTNSRRLPAKAVGFSRRFGPAPTPINSLVSSTMSVKFQKMKRIGA
eukprot:172857-Pyramimonas_sp.AAC.1